MKRKQNINRYKDDLEFEILLDNLLMYDTLFRKRLV